MQPTLLSASTSPVATPLPSPAASVLRLANALDVDTSESTAHKDTVGFVHGAIRAGLVRRLEHAHSEVELKSVDRPSPKPLNLPKPRELCETWLFPSLTFINYLKIDMAKAECARRGLDNTGLKWECIGRLRKWQEAQVKKRRQIAEGSLGVSPLAIQNQHALIDARLEILLRRVMSAENLAGLEEELAVLEAWLAQNKALVPRVQLARLRGWLEADHKANSDAVKQSLGRMETACKRAREQLPKRISTARMARERASRTLKETGSGMIELQNKLHAEQKRWAELQRDLNATMHQQSKSQRLAMLYNTEADRLAVLLGEENSKTYDVELDLKIAAANEDGSMDALRRLLNPGEKRKRALEQGAAILQKAGKCVKLDMLCGMAQTESTVARLETESRASKGGSAGINVDVVCNSRSESVSDTTVIGY